MKSLHVLVATLLVLTAADALGAERKPIRDVDSDALTGDTQVLALGAGDDHIAMVWWIPVEFWQSTLARDPTTSDSNKRSILETLSGTSLLSVVQADISDLGAFDFYRKEEVAEKMTIDFTGPRSKKQALEPMRAIDPDLEIVLGVLKPVLGAAMGNLGNNMHFYVLNDRSADSTRLVDPYRYGLLSVQLSKRTGERMTAEIEMPLDSLFVPRKCPNGKDAHISWIYCPWSGERLPE